MTKTYTRPPNKGEKPKPGAKPGAKPKPRTGQPFPPPGQGGGPGGGGGGGKDREMSVVITIGEVEVSIKGPIVAVMAVLQKWFGTSEPAAMIARLQLVFGPQVSMATKKK